MIAEDEVRLLFRDDFDDVVPRGRVVGRESGARGGLDREGLMSVDNGALRIRPARRAGWGRTALAYGPIPNHPGTAFAVALLNGHNTSQAEPITDTFGRRLDRWLRGSETAPRGRRLRRWLASGRVGRVLRQMRWWWLTRPGQVVPRLDENMAVGLQGDPAAEPGPGMLRMHATGAHNGELQAAVAGGFAPVLFGVQNVPLLLVSVRRDSDVLHYAGSLDGARGLPRAPRLRPLAVGSAPAGEFLRPGLQQAVLGQIGFRIDSRLYAAAAAVSNRWSGPRAGAHAEADRVGEAGWRADPGAPTGLIRAVCDPTAGAATLHWRGDGADGWRLEVDADGTRLSLTMRGTTEVLAEEPALEVPTSLQILDDGHEIAVLADARLLFGSRIEDARLAAGTALSATGPLADVEAHPRWIEAPPELALELPSVARGDEVLAADDFAGATGPLDGRPVAGGAGWRRIFGRGTIEAGGGAARVVATPEQPCPGRTLHTVDWADPDFADLEVVLTPPGTARGQKQHGSSGFVLWQDDENHIVTNIWLDDCYGGASMSSFYTIDGFEDLYDAVWTNVGSRVSWGVPVRLRLVFDRGRFTIWLDDEPVLHRALSDVYRHRRTLAVRRVGLAANWEWGNDTGSTFADFKARGRSEGGESC